MRDDRITNVQLRLSIPSCPFRQAYEVCLVDGSLFASNPAMLALAEARTLFPGEDDFLLVSLGCGEPARARLPADLQQKRRHIFESSLTAQSACTDYQMRAFLPSQRYIRIQADLLPGFDRIDDALKWNCISLGISVLLPGQAVLPERPKKSALPSQVYPSRFKSWRSKSALRSCFVSAAACFRDQVLTACTRRGAYAQAIFESDQFSSIFPLVASGFGVSIIPEMAAPLATGCRVVPLGPASVRRVGYFRNRRCFSSKAAKAFVSWLRTVAQEQGQEPVRSRSKEFIPAGAMSTN